MKITANIAIMATVEIPDTTPDEEVEEVLKKTLDEKYDECDLFFWDIEED